MFGLLDSDIDNALSDLGVSVVFGSQTVNGILDAPGHDVNLRAIGAVSTVEYSLTYRTTALSPAPKPTDSIVIDGTTYIVRDSTPMDDGKLTRLGLKTK